MKTAWCLAFVVVLMGVGCRSLPPEGAFTSECVTNACRAASSVIVIDGVLDEPSWAAAVPVTRFYEFRSGAAVLLPTNQVQARFLHDRQNLYVGATVRDRDIVCNPAHTNRTEEALFLDGDVFEVFIQPDRHQTVYYEFHVNPQNVTWDCRLAAKVGYMNWTNSAPAWNSKLKSAVRCRGTLNQADTDEGYTVEIAIPLTAFTDLADKMFATDPGVTWRFSTCLYDYSRYYDDCDNAGTLNLISSSKMPRADYHTRGYFNSLKFE